MSLPSFAIKLEQINTAQKKDGSFPIVLRIIYNRIKRRIRTGLTAYPHQFVNGRLKKVYDVDTKNELLQLYENTAENVLDNNFKDNNLDYKKWKNIFEKEISKGQTCQEKIEIGVLEFCMLVHDEKIRLNKVKSAYDYKNLHSILSKYTSDKEINFYEIKKEHGKKWLKGFERFMIDRGLKGVNYMRVLKSLYSKAISGYIDDIGYLVEEFSDTPFKGVWNPRGYDFSHLKKRTSTKYDSDRIRALSSESIKKILEYKSRPGTKEEYYMALWKFGYLMSGVNFKDVALLKWSDIKNGKWYYKRSKTSVGAKDGKPIPKYAWAIIEKYGDKNSKYVFNILNGGWDKDEETLVKRVDYYSGYIFKCAKRVSKKLDLDGYFTPYSGRHSAINIALSSGINSNTIRTAVDQKSLSAIDSYTSDSEASKLREMMEALVVTDHVSI